MKTYRFLRVRIAVLQFIFCLPSLCLAQSVLDGNSRAERPLVDNFVNLTKVFSDKSKVSFLGANYYNYLDQKPSERDSSFVLDAHITPNYYFGDEIDDNNINKHNWLIDLNVKIDIRILKSQFSGPIRTASFKPGGRLHYSHPSWNKTNADQKSGLLHSVYAGFYHFSNGQDGNSSADNSIIRDNDTLSYINEGHKLNVYNGSFSTNYVDLGYNLFYCLADGLKKFHFNSNLELHYRGKNIEFDGFISRFNHSMEFNFIDMHKSRTRNALSEQWRTSLRTNIRYGNLDNLDGGLERRFDITFLYSHKLPYTTTVSGFISVGYLGSDHYNIYLEDRFVFAKFGLSIGDFINY